MATSDPPLQARRGPVAPLSFLVLAFFLYKLAPTVADADLWGHVRFGGDLLQTGRFVRPDVYSYASGVVPWINHELLAEVAFYLAWSLADGTGLVLLKCLVGLAVAGALWLHMLRAGLHAVRAGIVLIVAAFALLPTLATVRPQMFTVLFFTALMLVLHAAVRGRPKLLWTLPVILAVWINFHGGVLAGLAVVFVYAGVGIGRHLVGRERRPAWFWLLPVACALALLLNPFGYRLPEFLLRTATAARPEISEWAPLSITSLPGLAYLLLLGGMGLAILRHPDRTSPELVAVYLATAIVPLTAMRHASLFAVAAIVVGARPLVGLRIGAGSPSARRGPFERPVGRGLLLLAGLIFLALALPHFRQVVLGPPFAFPARAVDRLERSGVEGRLATDFDWGEYALWHLYPEILVAPDGRRETVYDPDTYGRYLAFHFGAGDWDAFLENPAADLVLVPAGNPPANLLRLDDGWTVVHEDETAVLFSRVGFPGGDRIRDTSPGMLPSTGAGLAFPKAE